MSGYTRQKHPIYNRYVKRLLDMLLSCAALLIIWPILLVIGLVIRLDSYGPAIFVQERVGLDQKPFRIYKFRSMVKDAQLIGPGSTAANDARITRVGGFLRKTSLDELPQLINVLCGHMSIVGPRPSLRRQMSPENPNYIRRFTVRPGITGLAQVNGRSNIGLADKIRLDAQYAEDVSLSLDLKILFKTVLVVILRKDTN